MDEIPVSDSERGPTGIDGNLDAICDRFEAGWRAGERPRIEDFLGDATSSRRETLFGHLLAVELDYRHGLGELPESADYRARFGEYDRLVGSIFADMAQRLELARVVETQTLGPRATRGRTTQGIGDDRRKEALPQVAGFEVLAELGRGGMGIVYKARNLRLNRLCALKMVLPAPDSGAEAYVRFLAEAETIARFRHPNLVQIHSFGEHEGRPYFEMEYFEGGSLARRLDGTPWAPEVAARMLAALARAMEDVHRLGIVHRDLKPANILLKDDLTPKIVDFGLAKSLETDLHLTQSGVFVGTPSYAAPEQVLDTAHTFGPAADIYALGAISYHMLTGRPPFQAVMVLQTLEQVRTVDPVPPSRLQPSLPRDAETITLKCLDKDPRRRYANAADLAEDLDRFLDGRPIRARPAGPAEHLHKWFRRRPAVALLSLLMAASSLLSLLLIVWQWRRAEAKAVAEAVANERAQQARLIAFEGQAQLMSHQALALCEQGEVARGVTWLARSLELATAARSEGLSRPLRINLADWLGQLIRPSRQPAMHHPGSIRTLAFRQGGRILDSVGRDGVVRSWAVATGRDLATPGAPTGDPPAARAGAGDQGTATAARAARVRVASAPAGPDPPPGGGAWSARGEPACGPGGEPAGRRVAAPPVPRADDRSTAGEGADRRIPRRDVTSRRLHRPRARREGPAVVTATTPDGQKIISGEQAGRLHVRDAATSREFDMPPQETEVTALSVAPDGRIFACGTEGGVVRLWDMALLGPIGQTIKLAGAVNALAFSPGGRILAVGEDDGTIRLWEIPPLKALGPPLRLDHSVQSVAFDEDGRHLLVGTTQGARLYGRDGRVVAELGSDLEGGASRPSEVAAVSPDGRTMVTARSTDARKRPVAQIAIRDAATGEPVRRIPDQSHPFAGLAYSPDSKWLLTWGAEPGTVQLWEVATRRDPRPLARSLPTPIRQAAFGRDGRSLLLGCRDGKARLWDLHRDVEIDFVHRPYHAYPITAVAFDPRRSRVVTGCHAGTIRVWGAQRGEMLHDLHQNAGEIAVLAFSPDGSTFVTASHDGTARFLDAESGKQLGPTLLHTDAVLCVAFDPDGRSIVTGTRDGFVQRWSVPSPPKAGEVAAIRRQVAEQTGVALDGE